MILLCIHIYDNKLSEINWSKTKILDRTCDITGGQYYETS